jgi:hypothetical protein
MGRNETPVDGFGLFVLFHSPVAEGPASVATFDGER